MESASQNTILETYTKLSDIISAASEEEINTVPFEGSWTAAQTAQHIILASSGLPALFAGKKEKTTREPHENVKKLDSIFLDFETKYQSPENIKPEIINYSKDVLVDSIKKIQSQLFQDAETYDLTLTCMDTQVPGFDNFTIYEWIHFAIVHTQRHTYQIKNILEAVRKP